MRRSFLLIAVVLPLAGTACAHRSAPAQATQAAQTAAAPADSELARARRLWAEKGPKSYRYLYRASCFCYIRDELEIVVENGRMTSARRTKDGDWVAETFWVAFPTVEELFDAIEKARREGTPVEARYDPELGYPTDVTIGTMANDAGVRHILRALEPLGQRTI